jgi:coenzyme F420-0:L-glutamate ligase / coenzyme F420-1:gamma-L-glutamate ligase
MKSAPDSIKWKSPEVQRLVRSTRVARLGTLNETGTTHLVPIVFASDSACIYFVIDEKTKRTRNLKRIRNIERTGRATVLIDLYSENWDKLAFVMVYTKASILERKNDLEIARAMRMLKRKYEQYRGRFLSKDPKNAIIVRLEPQRIIYWKQN